MGTSGVVKRRRHFPAAKVLDCFGGEEMRELLKLGFLLLFGTLDECVPKTSFLQHLLLTEGVCSTHPSNDFVFLGGDGGRGHVGPSGGGDAGASAIGVIEHGGK